MSKIMQRAKTCVLAFRSRWYWVLILITLASICILTGVAISEGSGVQSQEAKTTFQTIQSPGSNQLGLDSQIKFSGGKGFFKSLWRGVKKIFQKVVDFFKDIIQKIQNTFAWFANLFCKIFGVNCINLKVGVGWVGLQGAPLVDNPGQPGHTWTQVAQERLANASQLLTKRAAISMQAALNKNATTFPTIPDVLVLPGHLPGNVIEPELDLKNYAIPGYVDLGLAEMVIQCYLADLALHASKNPYRMANLHIGEFTATDGSPGGALGIAVPAGIFVAPWAVLSERTMDPSPPMPDEDLVCHENLHLMCLWDLKDASYLENLMYWSSDVADNKLLGWQVTLAQTTLFLAGWVSSKPVFKAGDMLFDPSLIPPQYEPSFVHTDVLFTPFGQNADFVAVPHADIMKGAVRFSKDSGSTFQILVPMPPAMRPSGDKTIPPRWTKYYISLDLDMNALTGGDPSVVGAPSSGTGGAEIVGIVFVHDPESNPSVTTEVWSYYGGGNFIKVSDSRIKGGFIDVQAIALKATGTTLTNIAKVAQLVIPYSIAPIIPDGLDIWLGSYDFRSQLSDITEVERMTFVPPDLASLILSPSNICPGNLVTAAATGLMPNSPVKLFIDDEEINIPAVTTGANGEVSFTFRVPYDLIGDLYTVSVGDDQHRVTAEAMLLVYSPFHIQIEKVHNALQGHIASVNVLLSNGPDDFAGFDFLFDYDDCALAFMGASPGPQFFGSDPECGWEYFTYRYGQNDGCEGCLPGLIRIIGLAETNNGPNHPSCFMPDDFDEDNPAIMFTLDFLVSNDRTLECMFIPIGLCWCKCSDNCLASVTGDTLWVDGMVLNFENDTLWNEFDDADYAEPNRPDGLGTPDTCLGGDKTEPVRCITFVDGGIDIICSDSIDARGDINVNGVKNEIADAVMFTNYFVSGLSAFGDHQEASIAASDVNADGIAVSVADLVYLVRIITGDAPPYPKLAPLAHQASVGLQVNHSAAAVSTNAPVDIGAGYFVLEHSGYEVGEPSLINGASVMSLKYSDENGILKVLVYSLEKGVKIPAGIENIFAIPIQGDGAIRLTDVQLSDYYGNLMLVKTEAPPILPTAFALHQNYPNPFNAATTIIYELPAAGHVTIDVFNVLGQKVATLMDAEETAGIHSAVWNGTDERGNVVSSGMYLYRMTSRDFTAERKMVLLK